MTAEVVVMNPEGVALAADSAITLFGSKILNSASKLYTLAHGHSVGLMIYNVPRFMDLPWEIIIKKYRDYIKKTKSHFDTLEGYAENFIGFINENEDDFSTDSQQKAHVTTITTIEFGRIFYNIYHKLRNWFDRNYIQMPEDVFLETINDEIDNKYYELRELRNIYKDSDEEFYDEFISKFSKRIKDIRQNIFEKIPLSENKNEKLSRIIFYNYSKIIDEIDENNFYTGVVFAGYGDEDMLPKCISYKLESFILGRLKYIKEKSEFIELNGSPAKVIPFAQGDITDNIMIGRHPKYKDCLFSELKNNDKIYKENTDIESIINKVDERMDDIYKSRIIRTIHALPKEDLPTIAETIVNLTSFMRRVSMSLENVAGPVDVALISKKDGFIWIKRKHYFDLGKNIYFGK